MIVFQVPIYLTWLGEGGQDYGRGKEVIAIGSGLKYVGKQLGLGPGMGMARVKPGVCEHY